MRTTLTLDNDIAAKLKAQMRRTGRSFRETVNHYLRLGLTAKKDAQPKAPFTVRARPMGVRPGLDYDRTSELVEHLDGPLAR